MECERAEREPGDRSKDRKEEVTEYEYEMVEREPGSKEKEETE